MAADPLTGFCRDCFAAAADRARRCAVCGSPRLLRHAELASLGIAHIDCDAFYAAVEKRDRPELRDQPVIIGGGKRGVVSTACYIARVNGVRSAMPMFKALALCPHAVVVKPDMAKYVAVGRQVRDLMLSVTPLVEPLSLDEAFLDLRGTDKLHHQPPSVTLAKLALRVERELGITVSVGLSYNKYLAKLASDLEKPRGFAVIGEAEAKAFLAPLPVGRIFGVGKAMQARLAADGIATLGQLQNDDEARLVARYGSIGRRLHRFARGEDTRLVDPERETKSVSAETTFNTDIGSFDELSPVIWRLSQRVSDRLKKSGLAGRTVTLKLKGADFKLRARSLTLGDPTQLAETLYQAALPLLRAECDGTPFRLAGIGLSGIEPAAAADQPNLLDPQRQRVASVERAMDAVRAKFGNKMIDKGRSLAVAKQRTPRDTP
jgi:DNA polymerase-4